MDEQALEVVSDGQEIDALVLAVAEQEAALIAESINWQEVQKITQRNEKLSPVLAVAVDMRVRKAGLEPCSPLVRLAMDWALIGALEVEATAPRYLELPAVIASLASHPLFEAARSFGRAAYREAMYGEDESGEVIYAPLEFTREEVLALVDMDIRLQDRRLAVSVPLAWRAGFVVGFLSALSVAQPDEAQAGLIILVALVAPLLRQERQEHGCSSRLLPARSKGKHQSNKR